ncbi:hypothetical protein SNEBB_000378 [Seison nebaliae]|nr:hypothetical protein SNEBB_000378 [Seison nebaliae]
MPNRIIPEGFERRRRNRIGYDKFVDRLTKLRMSMVLIRKKVRKVFSKKRRITPQLTVVVSLNDQSSSYNLNSEVSSEQTQSEWTREDGTTIKKISRIRKYWTKKFGSLKETLSTYRTQRLNTSSVFQT